MRACCIIVALVVTIWAPLSRAGDPGADLYDRLSAERLSVERLDDARRAVIAGRDKLAAGLEKLARGIEKRKAARGNRDLLPDLTLQDMLRRSQESAKKLTMLNRELDALNAVRGKQLIKLAGLYDELAGKTSRAVRLAAGDKKASLVKALMRLRRERQAIGRELLAGVERAAPLETDDLLASDDPDELAERADAVRDEQDRLRRKLSYLDERIADAGAQVRLDLQMRDFVADHELFGEESRVLKVTRTTAPETGQNTFSGSDTKHGEPSTRDDTDIGYDPAPGECADGMCGTPDESLGGGGVAGALIQTEQGSLPMGMDSDAARLEGLSPPQLLKALRDNRSLVVTQIKKLQILQDRIQEKAEILEGE
ncbi:MAG TPA: hypothetical protein VM425_21275 [Myxococcota bacterium]|nr:hypothetical protein [Myxococcota bacterium]